MAALLQKIFRRKRPSPLVCSVALDDGGHPLGDDPNHVHTAACFVNLEPLSVVELFQSQGCKACVSAVPGIQEATNHPNMILLTFNVTIFDHLGWKDTYASTSWDQRQRAYAMKWQRSNLYTQQIVINGAADGSGAGGKTDVQDIMQIAKAAHANLGGHVYLDANDSEIRIDSDMIAAEPCNIVVVLYRGGDEIVKIKKGPNKGKKLNHRNVVTSVLKIGEWFGGNMTVPLPASKSAMQAGEEAVVLLQQSGNGGQIISVVKV